MDLLITIRAVLTLTIIIPISGGIGMDVLMDASLMVQSGTQTDSMFSPLSEDAVKNLNLKVMKQTQTSADSCLEICKGTTGCVRVIHCLHDNPCKSAKFCIFSKVGTGICYQMGTEGQIFEGESSCKISKVVEDSATDVQLSEISKEHDAGKEYSSDEHPHFSFAEVSLPGASRMEDEPFQQETQVSSAKEIPAGCLEERSFLNQGVVRKAKTDKPGYPVVTEYGCGQQGKWTYKYVTGTTEALCDEEGRWTLPALICIPTNCFLSAHNSHGKTFAWYGGDVSREKGGHECKEWTSQSPLSKTTRAKRLKNYPGPAGLAEAGNRCRDFGRDGEPWCYTEDPLKTFAFCPVETCSGVIKCGMPPNVPGARPIRTEIGEDVIHVTYTCHDQLIHQSSSTTASCNRTTGMWTWPDILCYSTECYYVNSEVSDGGMAVYRGDKMTTVTGRKCQRFDSQYPHKHTRTNITRYLGEKSLADVGNKCRDPDGESAPWCYTTDPKSRWELCGIPECKFY